MKSKISHTPGPWKIQRSELNPGDSETGEGWTEVYYTIYKEGAEDGRVITELQYRSDGADLLEACKTFLDLAAAYGALVLLKSDAGIKIQEAIVKAEGK